MTKFKILQIVGSPEGGMGTHIASISEYLCKDYNVSLAASMDKTDKSFDDTFNRIKASLDDVFDIKIEKKPSFKDLKKIFILYRHFQNKEIKIIHGHGAKGGLYARILGFLLGTKVIYSPHGGSLHSMHGSFMNLIYLLIEKVLYYFTDKIVLDSHYEKTIYLQKINRHSEKLFVNYNGVTVENMIVSKSLSPVDETVIASFGILRHLKGHDILIRAISILVEHGFNVKANIYGEGPERDNLEKLIRSLGLEKRVFLQGFIEDTKTAMLQSDIVIHPSRFDALPYVPIEAMNLMRPVIVSDAGGLTEIVEDKYNGLVFINEDVEGLVSAIETLLNDPKKCEAMVLNGRNVILEKFDTKVMFGKLDQVYKSLLQNTKEA